MKLFTTLLFYILIMSSCYYDNEQELYPNSFCDIENVSYSESVLPILVNRCFSCHSSSTASSQGSGIILEGYDILIDYVEDGSLYGSVSWDDCCSNMPKSANKLSECQLLIINKWIDNGALDD